MLEQFKLEKVPETVFCIPDFVSEQEEENTLRNINKAPKVKFVSKMFHPNIYLDGSICLDVLQSRWSPTYDVAAILTSIQSLLDEPNPISPANAEAANLYQTNKREYKKKVETTVSNTVVVLEKNKVNDYNQVRLHVL